MYVIVNTRQSKDFFGLVESSCYNVQCYVYMVYDGMSVHSSYSDE